MRAWFSIFSALSLSGVGALFAQEVTLPLASYESLRHRANPPPVASPAPPAPFTLEEAAIEIRPSGDSARVVQLLTLSIYAEGWHSILLADAGSITGVELSGLEGRVVVDSGSFLVARGIGRHNVQVESVLPLVTDETAARTTRTLSFTLPRAGVVTGVVDLGSDSVATEEVRLVTGALPRGVLENARLEFVGDPAARFDLRLLGEDRALARSRLPLKFDASSATLTRLGRTRLEATAFLVVDVQQGRLDSLRVAIPQGLDVVRVEAADVGWRVDAGVLVLTPGAPVEDRLQATVVLQGPSVNTLLAPVAVPEGASRTTFVAGLKVEADGIPILEDMGDARRAETSDLSSLPAVFGERDVRSLRVLDLKRPPRYQIQWSDTAQQQVLAAQVDRLVVDTVVGRSGGAGYQCWAFVRASGASSLTLRLPEGFVLSSAERDGTPLTPGITPQGLELPLGGGTDLQVVHVAGVIPFRALPQEEKDEVGLDIPLPSLSAPIGRVEVRTVLPGEREYELESLHAMGGVQGWEAMTPFPTPEGFRVVEASWTALTSTPEPLVLEAKPRKQKRPWF